MFPDNILRTEDILFAIADFFFLAWPILLVSPLESRSGLLRKMLIIWVICALTRVAIVFDSRPHFYTILIREPWNTLAFSIAGMILFVLFFVTRRR